MEPPARQTVPSQPSLLPTLLVLGRVSKLPTGWSKIGRAHV